MAKLRFLPPKKFFLFLKSLEDISFPLEWNHEKNYFSFSGGLIRLPENWFTSGNFSLERLSELKKKHFSANIILMQAGRVALGVVKENKLIAHKNISKYMVRKKQGKSQLNYLKSKGKSRAGSRLRLRESKDFFKEINQKLNQWQNMEILEQDFYYNCPVRLWAELFSAEEKPPFEKRSQFLHKIPFYTGTPTLEELKKTILKLRMGVIEYDPPLNDKVGKILDILND